MIATAYFCLIQFHSGLLRGVAWNYPKPCSLKNLSSCWWLLAEISAGAGARIHICGFSKGCLASSQHGGSIPRANSPREKPQHSRRVIQHHFHFIVFIRNQSIRPVYIHGELDFTIGWEEFQRFFLIMF